MQTLQNAIEIRGLQKRFSVGAGRCAASADILRGITFTVRAGEAVAITGPCGSGKSTLLLCLAGLLAADGGEIRWFGATSRAAALQRAMYHATPTDLLRAGSSQSTHVHLVDSPAAHAQWATVPRWIDDRLSRGDAVVLASRDEGFARHCASRVVSLRAGRLCGDVITRTRVAEPAR
jgi:predicted ABC-type transport system involved in lysophospholipase L1 biosynthesis ATPase subunit